MAGIMGAGPATSPGPQPGAMAQGTMLVKLAMDALQKALPALPMGAPMHAAVLKALTDIGKHMDHGGTEAGDPASQIQQLIELIRQARSNSNPGASPGMPPGAPPGAPPGMPPGAPPQPGAPPAPPMLQH